MRLSQQFEERLGPDFIDVLLDEFAERADGGRQGKALGAGCGFKLSQYLRTAGAVFEVRRGRRSGVGRKIGPGPEESACLRCLHSNRVTITL